MTPSWHAPAVGSWPRVAAASSDSARAPVAGTGAACRGRVVPFRPRTGPSRRSIVVVTEPGDLERRVRRLEEQGPELRGEVAAARTDAAAARVLAAGADRDVSEVRAELRAHTSARNALRESQRELCEGQRELTEGQRELSAGQRAQGRQIDSLEREMRTGFATVNAGVSQILTLLSDRPQGPR